MKQEIKEKLINLYAQKFDATTGRFVGFGDFVSYVSRLEHIIEELAEGREDIEKVIDDNVELASKLRLKGEKT